MNETFKDQPDAYIARHPQAVVNKETAHTLAIEGDRLETLKAPYKLAKRAIETAYITGEKPIDVAYRALGNKVDDLSYERKRSRGEQMDDFNRIKSGWPNSQRAKAQKIIENGSGSYTTINSKDHVESILLVNEITQNIEAHDEALAPIYNKSLESEAQKARAEELGYEPDDSRLL